MHIGARIAAERKLRGLNQRQLSDRAHVSHSLLTKVEQGKRPASPALISAVSRALDLDRGQLTGQPFRFNGRGDHAIHDLVPPLRREILSAFLPPETDRAAPSVAELRTAVAELSGRAEAGEWDQADLAVFRRWLYQSMYSATGTTRSQWPVQGPQKSRRSNLLALSSYGG